MLWGAGERLWSAILFACLPTPAHYGLLCPGFHTLLARCIPEGVSMLGWGRVLCCTTGMLGQH